MTDDVTPQEWRIRREMRALAWFAASAVLMLYLRSLADIEDPFWWMVRDLAYQALAGVCFLRGLFMQPGLPKRMPDRDREWA